MIPVQEIMTEIRRLPNRCCIAGESDYGISPS